MEKGETQVQSVQPEVNPPTTSTPEPHLWNNLLRWCNSDLQNQMKRVNARPHECKTCGKRFTLLENLNRHQMIHTNQRPFHCPYCSKSFRLSQHLKEHIRIHTGEKPYKCHICGHAFCQISNLKSHQKTHTKVKGFRCDQCGKEFRRSFTLKQHKLTHAKSAKPIPKASVSVKIPTTLSNGNKSPTQFRSEAPAVMATNPESKTQLPMLGDIKENTASKFQPSSKSENLLYKNLMTTSPTEKGANKPHKEKEAAQLMSLWNTIYQMNQAEKSDKTKNPTSSDYFRLANRENGRKSTNTYSNISKFLELANSNQSQNNGAKSRPSTLLNLPFFQSEQWKSNKMFSQAPFNLSVRKSSNEENSPLIPHTPSTEASQSSDASSPNSKFEAQNPTYENTNRKRKQTQSLNESAMSCPALFDEFSTKNNPLFPRTRPYKSLTASQDYNWKRQLCREWQQTDKKTWLNDKGRSCSADVPRDGVLKPDLSPACVENKQLLNDRLVKSENKDSIPRASSSFDDDVFSPMSGYLSSSATPRDSNKSNLPVIESASRLNSVFQDRQDIFQYPYIPSAKRYRKYTESTSDSTKFPCNFKPRSDLVSINKSPVSYASPSIPPPLLSANHSPSLKHTEFSLHSNEVSTYDKIVSSNKPKTPSPHFPTSSPLFDFNTTPCFPDPLLTPKLPLSPDFKSLSSRLSFVPMVTWKPVVTGWRNVLDGNIYPARMRVDNMNPFSLQQQIS